MNTQIIRIVLLGTALAGCGKDEPRSKQYFDAHVDEAREVFAGCQDGSVRGDECNNAEMAVSGPTRKRGASGL